ncbi:RNA polymerase sigma-70 factor, ECF subfamily [Pustulibacterium marinum]|uniref:RNA polymerase sigma-70 factor, ECF subfamily n=2 Tax=Pustulibacterium marinum TaxID=1224947 RepID=A0A1I7IN74_9FLAO|nr:RNA polymerase sigma-70 factor, ECF subfamily [Pustulibacterium marinum]
MYQTCNEHHFSFIFKTYEKSLRNFLYYKFGDEDQAFDTAQEAFITLWKHCSDVPWEKAKGYLFTVAYKKALKVVAHKKVVLQYAEKVEPNLSTNESPEFLIEEAQFKQKLLNAIDALKPHQKEAFLMHRIDKIKYREIAEALDISVKAVEKRIHQAMLNLKKHIEHLH